MNDENPRQPGVLAAQRLRRTGLEVKLDKGFAKGTYCIYVEFDSLETRVGFEAGHRTAMTYCAMLKKHLGQPAGCKVGEIHDGSASADPRRNHDLESTFLWFSIETDDGRFHDEAVRRDFETAALRAGQAWDQVEARLLDRRRDAALTEFRRQLAALLRSSGYAQMDEGSKEQLLADVTALVFPPRHLER